MTTGIFIRDYVESDVEAVVAIAKDLQHHELKIDARLKPIDAIGQSYIDVLRADVKKSDGRFIVAEYGGAVAGYCTLLTHCDSGGEVDEMFYRYSFVSDFGVLENMRSKGIGKALLEECEKAVRAAGIKYLRLAVMAENAGARKFYARAGFGEMRLRLEKKL